LTACDPRLLDILDTGSVWVWETDSEGILTSISDRPAGPDGLALTTLIGRRFLAPPESAHSDPNQAPRFSGDLAEHRAFRDVEIQPGDPRFPDTAIRCLISGKPVFDHLDAFRGYQGIGRFIDTPVAQMAALDAENARLRKSVGESEAGRQNAEIVNKAKSEFLANISHELRTPLSGIIGTNLLMQQTSLDARQRALSDMLGNSATALLELVNRLLDLSRIEARAVDLSLSELDPGQVVDSALNIVSSYAHEHGVSVSVITHPGRPATIVTDPDRLRQILLNLLSNAIKFSRPDLHNTVTLTMGPAKRNGLRVEVIDQGVGIPADELDLIFERYHRAHNGDGHGGTGLGLAICRQLVCFMQGEIGVESTLGEGTRFWVELPASPRDQSKSGTD
ncbi:MAG: ATP-binding protein, partial [Pseudomonadota bacterium]